MTEIEDFAYDYASKLNLNSSTTGKAIEIVQKAQENYITGGKKPNGVAAAAIYIAGILEDDRRTQKEIAEAAEIPESTIRNRYIELVKELNIKKK